VHAQARPGLSRSPSLLRPLPQGTHQGDGLTIARGEMKNAHTKRQRQNRQKNLPEDGEFCPEPKTASLIALYGDEVSYAWNVLEDLKVAGASIPGETLSPICFVVWALNNFFKEITMIRLSSRYAAPTSIRRNRPLTDDELMRCSERIFSRKTRIAL
jgi:hypothetical protein